MEAARALGASSTHILRKHIFPHTAPYVFTQLIFFVPAVILAEAGLSFLGLGIQPPTPSWGAMINAGRSHLLDAPHLTLFPGLAILITVMGLNFLGDALVGWINPHGKKRN